MKNTLAILITLAALNVLAQLQLPDFTTPHTNTTSSSGYLTVPGYFTNAPYFAYNFTNISYGESAASAWQKASNNWVWQSNQLAIVEFTVTNYMATNQLPGFTTNILTATVGGHTLFITNGLTRAVQ